MNRLNMFFAPRFFSSVFENFSRIIFIFLFFAFGSAQVNASDFQLLLNAPYTCPECPEGDSTNSDTLDNHEPDTGTESSTMIVEMEDIDYRKANPNAEVISLEIYPNPSTDFLFIKGNTDLLQVRIINLNGQVIQKIALKSQMQKISLTDFPKGTYVLQVFTQQGEVISKRISII